MSVYRVPLVCRSLWGDSLGCAECSQSPVGGFVAIVFGPVEPSLVTYWDQATPVLPLHRAAPHSCTRLSWVFRVGDHGDFTIIKT